MPTDPIRCTKCNSADLANGTSRYEFKRVTNPATGVEENVLVATIRRYRCNACSHEFTVRQPVNGT